MPCLLLPTSAKLFWQSDINDKSTSRQLSRGIYGIDTTVVLWTFTLELYVEFWRSFQMLRLPGVCSGSSTEMLRISISRLLFLAKADAPPAALNAALASSRLSATRRSGAM